MQKANDCPTINTNQADGVAIAKKRRTTNMLKSAIGVQCSDLDCYKQKTKQELKPSKIKRFEPNPLGISMY
jgi:hypothetical protein